MPWFGGKQGLAPKIVKLLPRHLAYIEAFAGGASVLFVKQPSKLDVYNDVDQGLVGFLRLLRERPQDLTDVLWLTPYSRMEYLQCRETWATVDDELERGRQWFVMAWQAFGGGGKAHHRTGWAYDRSGRKNGSRPATFKRRVEQLTRFAERLRHVQIECLDWRDCLNRYDGPDALFYLDPPYLPSTRTRTGKYAHELTEDDHRELLEVVVRLQGSVLLSGYDSALYRDYLEPRFERFDFDVALAAAMQEGKRKRRHEVVWRSVRR